MDKKFLIIHPTADGATLFLPPLKQSEIIIIIIRDVVSDMLSRYVVPEKVHFQHTAKFISQLINEKANYTLQVGELCPPPSALITNNPISLCLVESLLQPLGAL